MRRHCQRLFLPEWGFFSACIFAEFFAVLRGLSGKCPGVAKSRRGDALFLVQFPAAMD
jgi:hypothetical protein